MKILHKLANDKWSEQLLAQSVEIKRNKQEYHIGPDDNKIGTSARETTEKEHIETFATVAGKVKDYVVKAVILKMHTFFFFFFYSV